MDNVTPGEGGSFLLDPKTGKVKVLHKTEPEPHTPESEDLNHGLDVPQASSESKD